MCTFATLYAFSCNEPQYCFNGLICDLRMYDKILTEEDRKRMFQEPVNVTDRHQNLKHWWPLIRYSDGSHWHSQGLKDCIGKSHAVLRGNVRWVDYPAERLPAQSPIQNFAAKAIREASYPIFSNGPVTLM